MNSRIASDAGLTSSSFGQALLKIAVPLAAVFALLVAPAGSLADELPAAEATDAVEQAAADEGQPAADGAAAVTDTGAGVATGIPNSSVKLVIVGADVSATTSDAVVTDTGGQSQTVVQDVGDDGDEGVRAAVTINSATDPQRYEFKFPGAANLELLEDGSVLVYDQDGNTSRVNAPWAQDANGNSVATHFEIDGTTVTQVVDHGVDGVAYPVVADPWYGPSLIASVQWVGSTLQVYPTWWGRRAPWQLGWPAWGEVIARAGGGANSATMSDQFYCHWYFVRIRDFWKASWNLDSNRPYVGFWETVRRLCNP